jgi:hypothetical protein
MSTHRTKIHTEAGDFVIGVRGALEVSLLTPVAQEEAVRIQFLDSGGLRRRYAFRTFSEFFHMIEDAATQVDGRDVVMGDAAVGCTVLETEISPSPVGTLSRLRETIALALKSTDSTILDAAEQDYRGVFASIDEFIRNQIGEHLPPYLQWLLACCDPERLQVGYTRGRVRLWTIGLADERVIVFESRRERG